MSRKQNSAGFEKPAIKSVTPVLGALVLSLYIWLITRTMTGDMFLPIRWANYITPWILLGTTGLIFLSAFLKKWNILATASLVFALIVADTRILPQLPQAQIHAARDKISVLSFNIGRFNHNHAAIAKLIKHNPADIIFLQEVSRPANLLRHIGEINLNRQYYVDANSRTGLVMLSAAPIKSVHRLQGTLTRYKISHPLGIITAWNTHMPRGIWSTRGQDKVIENLLRDMKQTTGPQIVAGDFNMTPNNSTIDLLVTNRKNLQTGFIPQFTYPTPVKPAGCIGPWVQIDHILSSNHFSPTNLKRLKNYAGSDHYPISVELNFRGNAYTGLGKGKVGNAGEG